MSFESRIGEENYNTFGTKMKIVEYNKYSDIWIEFQDEYKARVHTTYGNFKKGVAKNPYDREVFNVGYYGIGKYKSKINKEQTYAYKVWLKMLQRCYDAYYLNKYPTYIDCYVCEEWHNFQNFAKWYEENYYVVNNERMELDKDILYKGNKIYSPKTCIFVPRRINILFTKRQNCRGKYPIGVKWHKRDKIFEVSCNDINCKTQYLGRFNNKIEAFNCYKKFKEKTIKQVANEYKNLIPSKLYEALYKYEIEIND